MELFQDAYRLDTSVCSNIVVKNTTLWYRRFRQEHMYMDESEAFNLFMTDATIHSWISNRYIHGVFNHIFRRKKGRGRIISNYLRIDEADIRIIENILLSDKIRNYADPGYFLGEGHDYTEFNRDDDLRFIQKALDSIKERYTVYYYSHY